MISQTSDDIFCYFDDLVSDNLVTIISDQKYERLINHHYFSMKKGEIKNLLFHTPRGRFELPRREAPVAFEATAFPG
jgi:hypothetical protein